MEDIVFYSISNLFASEPEELMQSVYELRELIECGLSSTTFSKLLASSRPNIERQTTLGKVLFDQFNPDRVFTRILSRFKIFDSAQKYVNDFICFYEQSYIDRESVECADED